MGRHTQTPRRRPVVAVGIAGVVLGALAAFGLAATGAGSGDSSSDQTCSFTASAGSFDGSVLHCTTPTTPPTTTAPPTTTPPTTTAPPTSPSPTPTVPPQTGWPNASNTGVPAGVSLASSGSITVTKAGTVLSGLNITGHVDIRAANVVIKNTKIAAGSSAYAIQVFTGSVTVQDSTITGSNGFAIGYDNWVGIRLNVSGVRQDGFKGGDNVTLQDSYIHDFTSSSGAHADGIQFEGGGSHSTIRHNYIDPANGGAYGNSAVFIKNDLGGNSAGPIVVDNNLLGGGNYTLYAVPGNGGNQSGIHIVGNHFLRDFQYGPVDIGYAIAEWSGNVYDSNGVTVAQ